MFDIDRWADWAKQQVPGLRARGFATHFTFTEKSRISENPAFFVDLDTDDTVGRIIVWSTGDFDFSVHYNGHHEAAQILGFPAQVTDDDFEAVFSHFVKQVKR